MDVCTAQARDWLLNPSLQVRASWVIVNPSQLFLCSENINWRYADLAVVKARPNTLVAVLEDHTKPKPADVVNKLVSIDTISRTVTTIADGADFYTFPCISPNGKKICWIQW